MAPTTNSDIQKLLESLKHPGVNNAPVLGINAHRMMRAQKGGYPHEMYHDTLLPIVVVNIEQEQAAQQHGYQDRYIPHCYPKMMYRRNMSKVTVNGEKRSKFAESESGPYVESVTVRDKAHEEALGRVKATKEISDWVDSPLDLRPLDLELDEDPVVTIAALNARVEELRLAQEQKSKKG